MPDTNQIRIKKLSSSDEIKGCGTFRKRKMSDGLFQDVKVLSLNCDSTFSYRHSNCIHPEMSSGTWTLNENTIRLSGADKVKRLAAKKQKTKSGYKYLDLDGATLIMNDSIVIWRRSDRLTDTLYRE